ncbi:MAG: phenylacetate--CoA ligase [Alicyclobacillus sp.]|nr:phenylacetate--CoA ligase [Alicyclobacillus sp.]
MESMPRDELQRLQLDRLQATVAHAYARVPLYRRRFEELGVHPDDIRDLTDVVRLPFTVKQDLRDTYPFGMFAVPRSELARIHASSGTKGKATVVGYTRGDLEVWAEVVARSIACAGARPGDILHNAYGYGLFTGGLGLHAGAERLGVTVVPASGGFTRRQVALLQDFGANGLCCTPSYALNIAETMADMGVDRSALQLRYGIFGAEPWTEAMRRRIEEQFGMDALNIYGLSEVMGPGVAMECPEEKAGLHVWEDHFLVEVVDPETGSPLPDGAVGELVFTSLTKQAFPVIRYRTGDLAAMLSEPCRCGRTHRRMSRVKGRVDDMLIIRGVNVFPQEVELELMQFETLAPHYQLTVVRDGPLDHLEVHVEWTAGVPVNDAFAAELSQTIAERLRERLQVRPRAVHIHPAGTLPRSEGKAVRVVDERALGSV